MDQYAKLKSIRVVCGERKIFCFKCVQGTHLKKNFVVDNKSNDDVWSHTSPPWSDLHE